MLASWSVGRKISSAFALITLLTVLAGAAGIVAARVVAAGKDHVIEIDWQRRLEVEELRVKREQRAKAVRSYLITRDDKFASEVQKYRDEMLAGESRLRETSTSAEERKRIDGVVRANADMQRAWDALIAERRAGASDQAMAGVFEKNQQFVKTLSDAMSALADYESEQLKARSQAATADGERAERALYTVMGLAVAMAAIIAYLLTRGLTRQVGRAVQEVQSSSVELQAAAAQQSAGSKELAATTGEVSTTMRELLATSRQIATSAQRVVEIAQETSAAAKSGGTTGRRANDALEAIRKQVEVVVSHMVDLGRKSQQIGTILDIINELAEQTNILSINATIEAAGAGEGGRRFAVVANEVRRLAERVGGSAREVRGLVEQVQAAANATVMATEDGRKAVDAGASQFVDVLSAFERIDERVGITTNAAREIELSTRQQSTAVEQVNVAINDVARAAKETEASTSQTSATATQLTQVSRQLSRLIRSGAEA